VVKYETWTTLRPVLNKAFKRPVLKDQIPMFRDKMSIFTDVIRKHTEDGSAFDMCKISGSYALEVMLKFGTGFENGRVLCDQIQYLFHFWFTAIPWLTTFHYWKYMYTPASKKMWDYTHYVEKIIEKMFKERLESGVSDEENDWLANLIRAHKENLLTYEQIKSNTFQLVPAGDTTPSVINWMFYYLAKNKNIQSKLRQVIFQNLGTRTDYTYDELQSIEYLDQVICETLRISPPVRAPVPRTLKRNLKMGDYFLPEGTQVAYCTYALHYNEKYWPNPTKFDPDRFLPEAKKTRPLETYAPFILGRRNCIGSLFGLAEIKTVTVELLREFEFSLGEKAEPKVTASWVVHPEKVILVAKKVVTYE